MTNYHELDSLTDEQVIDELAALNARGNPTRRYSAAELLRANQLGIQAALRGIEPERYGSRTVTYNED